VVTNDVPARVFVANEAAKPIAHVGVPLTKARTTEDFVRSLAPISPQPKAAPPSGDGSSQPTSLKPGVR
jgi:hypothetical protein